MAIGLEEILFLSNFIIVTIILLAVYTHFKSRNSQSHSQLEEKTQQIKVKGDYSSHNHGKVQYVKGGNSMSELSELKDKLNKNTKLLDKLDEKLTLGEINEAQYKKLSKKYEAEIENLKEQITEKELLQDVGLEEGEKEEESEEERERVENEDEPEKKYEQTNLIPASIIDNLPAMVRNEVVKLSAQKQEEFVEEYKRKAKSRGIAYILWLIGFHYLYVRKWGTQILFWITAGGLLIWWFIDLFRTGGIVRDYNKDVATDILRNLKAISG